MNDVRYALHRLVIGNACASSVLVAKAPGGAWILSPFESETERTIYVDGISRLRPSHDGEQQVQFIPFTEITNPISAQPITIAEAQGRLEAHSSVWVLEMPEE